MQWDPAKGPSPRRWLHNHLSARAHSDFVTDKVTKGAALGTMLRCSREDLWCILPLGVASNALGKLRLIWDDRWVNRHLSKEKVLMETPQREGRV